MNEEVPCSGWREVCDALRASNEFGSILISKRVGSNEFDEILGLEVWKKRRKEEKKKGGRVGRCARVSG